MTPERWRQIEAIFQAALDRDVSAREAYLDQTCAGDPELRREVDSLLSAHQRDDQFLESSALKHAARNLAGDMPRLSAGDRLGGYELIDQIGAGGMGEVWRALDPPLRRHVAIKVLSSQYSRDPDRLRRFEQEAQAAGMLNHPNVLAIYAVGEQEHSPYLVTELLEGETLRHRLQRGPIPEGKAIEYGDQIVQGLAAAHTKGIVHRDLKPENIFITADGYVKILDFGLAKLAQSGPEHQLQTQTASGIALGTPAYMSPEQVRGQAADHRSDIFSLGAVLYEMLSGRHPFLAGTSVETMNAILKQDPAPLTGVSPQLDQIVRHCLEKEPSDRYQSARDLGFQLRLVRHPSSPTPAPLPTSTRRRGGVAVVALIVLAVTVGGTWWLARPAPPLPPPTFKRLTSDSGLTTDPAFSPDGKLVVYASDRAGGANLDIWRQQLATGEAMRLTFDQADESEPTFSPDGSRIAFRSERDGGGIYTVSVFGGDPRPIAHRGRRPRFSPDGTRLAFWVGEWYIGRVFIVDATGGSPVPVQPDFAAALFPIWSPDSTKLLFLGARDPNEIAVDAYDWWVAPSNGGPAMTTRAFDSLRRQQIKEGRQFHSLIPPADWLDGHVFFSGWANNNTNLWRIAVATQTGQAEGLAERLTSGTSIETEPSVIAGPRIAFGSLTHALNVWNLPIAANNGKVAGTPEQVTSSAFDAKPTVSADGKKLVFISERGGNPDLWMKNLTDGRETALTATPLHEEEPEITADGTRVFYMVSESAKTIYQVDTAGGVPEKLCDTCGRPWDSSPDGTQIIFLIEEGRRHADLALGLFDTVRRRKTNYVVHPEYDLAKVRFSPDGRWISFVAINRTKGYRRRLIVAPFRRDLPPRDDEWIEITDETPIVVDKPSWSPDGSVLYYISEIDGFRCIWARRLDPKSKHPLGEPLGIYHSHSARRSLMNAAIPFLDLSVTADRLFFNLGEATGNIWMAEWKQ